MGGDSDPPAAGEIVYAAGSEIRTRRWVWRQSRSALVSADAENIFFPVDGFADRTLDGVEAATNFIAQYCRDSFGAMVSSGLVDAENRSFTA
jgi:DNA/RNA-binding domain of Phe-tRNA-synthetase-like protein